MLNVNKIFINLISLALSITMTASVTLMASEMWAFQKIFVWNKK